jgi:replicative DNA helicase
MVRYPVTIGDAVRLLRAEDFYADAHQKIFRAVVGLWHGGKPVDLVGLADLLHEGEQIQDIGGYAYLEQLWEAAPTAHGVEAHAQIILNKAVARQISGALVEITRDGCISGQLPAAEALEQAEKRLFAVRRDAAADAVHLSQSIGETYDFVDQRAEQRAGACGVRTGFFELDNLTSGLQPGQLVVVAARPSMGKTALAGQLLRNVALDQGIPAFFASLEQSRVELTLRLLCAEASLSSRPLLLGRVNAEDAARLSTAGETLRSADIWLDDSPEQTTLHLAGNARRLQARHGIGLVVVDYLQLIVPDNRKETREQQVAGISRRLKYLAGELKIPVVALAQLNRKIEDRKDKRPALSDLRESGAIEADADVVILLHRPEYYEPGQHEGVLELNVAKHRNGPTGRVELRFVKEYMRIENITPDPYVQRDGRAGGD